MRRRHFEAIRPLCPACQTVDPNRQSPLMLADDDGADDVLDGVLVCPHPACRHEFPIVDGIPVIVPRLRSYIAEHVFQLCRRDDLSASVESIVGDCCGPGSLFDTVRQHLSCYTWDHYADLDPEEPAGDPPPGSILRLLQRGLDLCGAALRGPIIDLGCGVGRGTFALAQRTHELVLGVDLNFPMLRLAAEVLRTGRVRYPRRRVGLVYDRREFAAEFPGRENVDFWACDATALPMAAGTFGLAVGVNVLDSVPSPIDLLQCLSRMLRVGGETLLTCPYDWSSAATPIEAWLGGHSGRSGGGSGAEQLRALLTPGGHAFSLPDLQLTAELDSVPWNVRMHERSVMQYQVHLVAARKQPEPA